MADTGSTPPTCPFHAGQPLHLRTPGRPHHLHGHVLSVHRHAVGWELTVAVFATADAPARTVNVVVPPSHR
jgi:hypothetical protein